MDRRRFLLTGQNIAFEFRGADGNNERLPGLAGELIRLKVDVLLTTGTPAAAAAKQATSIIPIVTAIVADPVGAGLVTNLARPGRNLTGIADLDDELTGKRLALLKEAVPGLSRVAIMWKTGNPAHNTALREAEAVAKTMNVQLQPIDVRAPSEFQAAFATMANDRVGALILAADSMFAIHRTQLVDTATKRRMPTVFWRKDFVVVVDGGTAAVAARSAISDIPVVIGAMADPVRDGIVASLARPGGNITGFSISTGPELNGKRLDLIREAVPGVARVAVVWNEGNPSSRVGLTDVSGAAKALGITIVPLGVLDPPGISRAFADAVRSRAGAVLTLSDAFLWSQREHIVAMAARYRLPTIYPEPEFATAGGLLAYGPNVPDNFRRAAAYVDRILKGTRPGDLPVERPTKFELIINLKTAKTLGLTIPPSVLLRADQVIE